MTSTVHARSSRRAGEQMTTPGTGGMTPALDMRPLDPEDLPWFVGIRNQVRHSLHDPREFSVDDARRWYAERHPDVRVIMCDGQRVGYFRVGPLEDDALWLGADLDPAFHGKGLASAAYRRFMPDLLAEFRASRVVLRVRPWNVPAMRLYLRLGFRTTRVEADSRPDVGETVLRDIAMEWQPGGADDSGPPPSDIVELLVRAGENSAA